MLLFSFHETLFKGKCNKSTSICHILGYLFRWEVCFIRHVISGKKIPDISDSVIKLHISVLGLRTALCQNR